MNERCENCPSDHAVVWCHAYLAWLCHQCRWARTEHELKPTGLIPAGLQPLEETT